jgi:hypothetical protein
MGMVLGENIMAKEKWEEELKEIDELLTVLPKEHPLFAKYMQKKEFLGNKIYGKGSVRSTYGEKIARAFGPNATVGEIRYEKIVTFYSNVDDDPVIIEKLDTLGIAYNPGKDHFAPSVLGKSREYRDAVSKEGSKITLEKPPRP